ncbi:hypothetical protein RclHR1_00970025 [Rhizophagus clarus]|uniref:Ribonuclease P protein subunit p20-like n=1 Tax=Rhizophagus clarus TaxID=94130 RepID=A0A2Z6S587_9GLOM|nr:hypothetical protein RclHR1_00970025 [Rhizophagus clarus]GES96692.1 ribonuclease P protein subunit p20-like [Rhizophagus clarus]
MGKAKKKSFGLGLSSEPYKNKKQDEKLEVSKEQSQDTFTSKVENKTTKKSYTKNESKKPLETIIQKKNIRKRMPQRPATIPTDIYVSRKSNFKGQLFRAKKLLMENGYPSITIHGLGAAIQKSINLVLALNDLTHNQIIYKTTTSTVQLVDDIIPDDDDKDLESQIRQNSAVHIQVSLKEDVKKYVLNKNNLPVKR